MNCAQNENTKLALNIYNLKVHISMYAYISKLVLTHICPKHMSYSVFQIRFHLILTKLVTWIRIYADSGNQYL